MRSALVSDLLDDLPEIIHVLREYTFTLQLAFSLIGLLRGFQRTHWCVILLLINSFVISFLYLLRPMPTNIRSEVCLLCKFLLIRSFRFVCVGMRFVTFSHPLLFSFNRKCHVQLVMLFYFYIVYIYIRYFISMYIKDEKMLFVFALL